MMSHPPTYQPQPRPFSSPNPDQPVHALSYATLPLPPMKTFSHRSIDPFRAESLFLYLHLPFRASVVLYLYTLSPLRQSEAFLSSPLRSSPLPRACVCVPLFPFSFPVVPWRLAHDDMMLVVPPLSPVPPSLPSQTFCPHHNRCLCAYFVSLHASIPRLFFFFIRA